MGLVIAENPRFQKKDPGYPALVLGMDSSALSFAEIVLLLHLNWLQLASGNPGAWVNSSGAFRLAERIGHYISNGLMITDEDEAGYPP